MYKQMAKNTINEPWESVFPYFGVDDISSHVCIQCQTCVPIISQLDLLYTILRKPVGLFICLAGDEENGG